MLHLNFAHTLWLDSKNCKFVTIRTVIDIHFFSIRSLTFYYTIPIILIRF